VIRAPYAEIDGVDTGQVKVYRINSGGSSWEQLGQSIYGNNKNDWFGDTVDISPDGNFLTIGVDGYDGSGYLKVFSLEGSGDNLGMSNWKQIGQDITGEASGDGFGSSVSLSNNAKTLAVGASYNHGKYGDDDHVKVY
jgi:hypothetical protein